MPSPIVAVIVSHNTNEMALALARRLVAWGIPVRLLDNGNESPMLVDEPGISYERVPNRGLWQAWHYAYCSDSEPTERFLLLNPDIELTGTSIERLIATRGSIATPVICDEAGARLGPQWRRIPSPRTELQRQVWRGTLSLETRDPHLQAAPTGACILIDRDTLGTALRVPRRAFLFGEEVLLALAAKGAIEIVPSACVVHSVGESRKGFTEETSTVWFEEAQADLYRLINGYPGRLTRALQEVRWRYHLHLPKLARQGLRRLQDGPAIAVAFLSGVQAPPEAESLVLRLRQHFDVRVVSLGRTSSPASEHMVTIGSVGEVVHRWKLPSSRSKLVYEIQVGCIIGQHVKAVGDLVLIDSRVPPRAVCLGAALSGVTIRKVFEASTGEWKVDEENRLSESIIAEVVGSGFDVWQHDSLASRVRGTFAGVR